MSDSTSHSGAYRLTPPAYQAYETSGGEQALLRSLTPENMGALAGHLANQRAMGSSRQYDYERQLREVNQGQTGIANARIEADRLEGLRKLAIAGVQFGGADLSGSRLFREVFDPNNLVQTDALRRQSTNAESMQRMGAGLNSASEAGVNIDPGQSVPMSPAGLAALRSTTGTTRDERVAGITAAGHVAAAGANGAPRVTMSGGLGSTPEVKVEGRNPEAVTRTFNEHRDSQRLIESNRLGGRSPPPAGAAAAPAPAAAARAGTPRNAQEARDRANALNIPSTTPIAEQRQPNGTVRWFAGRTELR